MISRHWSGRIKPEETENYINYLKTQIIPKLEKMEGFRGASIKRRRLEHAWDFLFISSWNSLKDIEQFAGREIGVAVVSETAQAMMTDFDKEVRHYEVIL
ncbi:MAG: hypothetical protein WBL27_11880 [Salinimicrobium sp.]